MNKKRYRISLLFNANKAYDRQVIEGVGEYLQASQNNWDIFIEEDFRSRPENIMHTLSHGIIADYDDIEIEQLLRSSQTPVIGVGGSYHNDEDYPNVNYIATDNAALIEAAFNHLKEKGINRFAFYGLPTSSGKRWAVEREYEFCQLMYKTQYAYSVYQGIEITSDNWQYAQNRLADWVQELPPKTGIIAVTDARARHLLQVCEYLNIAIPDSLSVIGIDNEEMALYLSRISLSSVMQGTRQIGYQAAKLLHSILEGNEPTKHQRILVPPAKVIARRSTDFLSLQDPMVIQAMHFIRNHACSGIRVEQVLDAVKLSRSNLETRFKDELNLTIHQVIYREKIEKSKSLLITSSLSINEIAKICGFSSLQYFYSVMKSECNMTPKEFRDKYGSAIH